MYKYTEQKYGKLYGHSINSMMLQFWAEMISNGSPKKRKTKKKEKKTYRAFCAVCDLHLRDKLSVNGFYFGNTLIVVSNAECFLRLSKWFVLCKFSRWFGYNNISYVFPTLTAQFIDAASISSGAVDTNNSFWC